jgi:3-hydroxyisobutyrate dehydrogenase-like beta-hydroxyacid dehydrogenase
MSLSISDRVAVLGLGIIGARACDNLIKAGWNVACWNRTPKGLTNETTTPAQAAEGAKVVSLYLKDSPSVRDVMEQIGPVLKEGQVVLNHSTLDLETTEWLDQFCLARGCRFLDAPFTGSKMAAGKGELVYYIGGDESLAQELDHHPPWRAGGVLDARSFGKCQLIGADHHEVSVYGRWEF